MEKEVGRALKEKNKKYAGRLKADWCKINLERLMETHAIIRQ